MMTRNDFELLARSLRATHPSVVHPDIVERGARKHYCDGYNAAINQITGACSSSNARFDADRFRSACGYGDDS